ncbi:hypothetical protein RvY_16094 [Ramazzottius varieornatus]|uniref:Uncharacterized protein n=1 Tax=Ramazzottius varieornatus TaxID=947166 RepID=A0A1D1VX86_RAMVA|nr:hypothetical protein RvY_16094 [Ramazzottius varieornatus]
MTPPPVHAPENNGAWVCACWSADRTARTSCCKSSCRCGLRARRPPKLSDGNDGRAEQADREPLSDEKYSADADSLLDEIKEEGKAAYAAGKEMLHDASDKAQEVMRKVWEATPFSHLPDWLKDNDFLHTGHRPQIESFAECFRSIFSIHTETGNIWTHLIGCVFFIGATVYFFLPVQARPEFSVGDKIAFAAYLAAAIVCLGFSFLYHTLYCHSRRVGLIFGKLDYCGIALLILGSMVPWLHYSFYCQEVKKYTYIGILSVLAIGCVTVSLWDKFSEPSFRQARALMFTALAASGLIPTLHYTFESGWNKAVNEGSLYWMLGMGAVYALSAACYASRIPERWYPGRFDIWFHSHQIFHVLVVFAALLHYRGVSVMASNRYALGLVCPNPVENIRLAQ